MGLGIRSSARLIALGRVYIENADALALHLECVAIDDDGLPADG
jgi:hypothetical protein